MRRNLLATAAVALALPLAACGSGSAPYSAGPPGEGAPAITLAKAELGLDQGGVDLQQDLAHVRVGGLSYKPVETMRYASMDGGFFQLLVFNTARTAQAALPSIRDNDGAADGGVITVVRNAVAVIPRNGLTGETRRVPVLLKRLPSTSAGTVTPQGDQPGNAAATGDNKPGAPRAHTPTGEPNETAGPAG